MQMKNLECLKAIRARICVLISGSCLVDDKGCKLGLKHNVRLAPGDSISQAKPKVIAGAEGHITKDL